MTSRVFLSAALASLPFLGGTLVAQDGPADRLTITSAVERALANYPTVGAATNRREAARAGVGVAQAAWFPSLTLAAAATQFEEPMIVTPIHGFTPGLTPPFDETLVQGAVTLSFTLFDGGARGARIGQARSDMDAALAALAATEQRLIELVVTTYVQVLAQGDVLEAHDRRLAALAAERERANQLLDAGRGAEVMVLRADAAVAEAEAVRVKLATGLEVTRRALARLIAAPVGQSADVGLRPVALGDSTLPDRDRAVDQAVSSSPEVERARHRVLAAHAGTRTAKGARWPSLSLVGHLIDRGSAAGDFTSEWDAGIQLSYPIFTGFATRNRIAQAEATAAAQQDELRLAELDAAHHVDRAYSAVEESLARVRSLERAVAGFTEVVRVERLVLETGAGTQTDYLEAEADLLAARADLAGARYGHLVARAQLARATGVLTTAWVGANLETTP